MLKAAMKPESLPAGRPRPYYPARSERKPMVKWFDPRVLFKTGMDVVKSALIGSQLDTRELQIVPEADVRDSTERTSTPTGHTFREYEMEGAGEFVFDFMADTGDGWDSTYSVASLLSRDRLNVPVAEGADERISLPRGRFLLIGSDLVYPSANLKEYRQRFLTPFGTAWDWLWKKASAQPPVPREYGEYVRLKDPPAIYAIPGNHDWYDSLSAFRMRFCNLLRNRKVGEWRTDQSRSYFVLKLPERWCVFGVDIGLDESVDNLQYNYFYQVVKKLEPDSRIILLAAEPDWVQGGVQNPRTYDRLRSVELFIRESWEESRAGEAPPRVWINLTGDTHCYQSYSRRTIPEIEADVNRRLAKDPFGQYRRELALNEIRDNYYPRVKFVAGGGGAFLHPTHGYNTRKTRIIPTELDRTRFDEDDKQAQVTAADVFNPEGRYPNEKTSKWLAFKSALLFLPRNLLLAGIFGLVYGLVGWTLNDFLDMYIKPGEGPPALNEQLLAQIPFASMLWLLIIALAFSLSAENKWRGLAVGLLQATAVFAGYCFLYYWLHRAMHLVVGKADFNLMFKFLLFVLQFAWGFILGSTIFAWSFYINLTFFHTDHNNAFSHASIAEYKNFQKYKIEKGGKLTVYSIAVPDPVPYSTPEKDEVDPAHWQEIAGANGEDWNRLPYHAQPGDKQLKPRPIRYFLIERVVIDPEAETVEFLRGDRS